MKRIAVLCVFLMGAMITAVWMKHSGRVLPPVEETGPETVSYFGGQIIRSFTLEGFGEEGERVWELKGDLAHIGETTDVFIEKNVVLSIQENTVVDTDKVFWKNSSSKFQTKQPVKVIHDKQVIEGLGAVGNVEQGFLQINRDIGMSLKGPVVITCRGPLKFYRNENRAVFYRDIMISDTRGTLNADRLDVYFDQGEERIRKIIASENVRIERDGNVSYSEQAVYDTVTQSVRLLGKPKIEIREKKYKFLDGSPA